MKRTVNDVKEERVVKKVTSVTISREEFIDLAAETTMEVAEHFDILGDPSAFSGYVNIAGILVTRMARHLFDIEEEKEIK